MRTVFAAAALNVLLLALRICCRLHSKQRLGLDDCKHVFHLFVSWIQHRKDQEERRLASRFFARATQLDK